MGTTKCGGLQGVQGNYGLDKVDFGTKFASEIMDAAQQGHKWADAIMKADQARVGVSILSPNNSVRGNENLYQALLTTVSVNVPQRSKDPTVQETFKGWAEGLKKDFPAMPSYSPASLGKRAANLLAVAERLQGNVDKLSNHGEVADTDLSAWRSIIGALKQYGEAAKVLHEKVCAGPEITQVTLDVQPRYH